MTRRRAHQAQGKVMFGQLILPTRDHRSLRIDADYAEGTAVECRRQVYQFKDVDVIALEGIGLR